MALDAMKPKATVNFGDASRSGIRILGSSTIAGHESATDFIVRPSLAALLFCLVLLYFGFVFPAPPSRRPPDWVLTAGKKTGPAPSKVKKTDTKTARMPENDLLDLIFACFQRFRYWSLRSLRAEIPQPEAYLRATLEKVADLHRSGTFANNWELKHENRRQGSATAAVKASDVIVEVGDSESDGDDDENVKMEDVL